MSPATLAGGKWLLVDTPPRSEANKLILTGLKYVTQRWLLERKAEPTDSPVFLWADEYQNTMNEHDALFMAESRSHLGASILLTQSQHSYLSSMSGDKGHHFVEALITNANRKLFHLMGDHASAEFASKSLGHRKEVFVNVAPGRNKGTFDLLSGRAEYDVSYKKSYQYLLRLRCFMEGLRTGGPSSGHVVDGIVISSKPFASGERYLKAAFSQL